MLPATFKEQEMVFFCQGFYLIAEHDKCRDIKPSLVSLFTAGHEHFVFISVNSVKSKRSLMSCLYIYFSIDCSERSMIHFQLAMKELFNVCLRTF